MIVDWIIQFVVSAIVVGAATWLSWRHPVGIVGLTLCLCLLITEVSFFGTSLKSRVVIEIVQAVVIVNAARIAFMARPSVIPALIVFLSVLDIAFCMTVLTDVLRGPWTAYIYDRVTAVVFFLQCVFVAAPGSLDALVGWNRDSHARRVVERENAAMDAVCDKIGKL